MYDQHYAYPSQHDREEAIRSDTTEINQGLSKLEYFAARAMQGLLSSGQFFVQSDAHAPISSYDRTELRKVAALAARASLYLFNAIEELDE